MDRWTSPPDQTAPYGTRAQTMDNNKEHVAHSLHTLTGFSPTYPQAQQQVSFFLNKRGHFQIGGQRDISKLV